MKLPKTSIRRGFTLPELVVVVAIVAILVGVGWVVSLDFYRERVLLSERDNVVGILRKARSEAMNNVNQSSHGVFIGTGQYVIFQGASYASRTSAYDESFPQASGFTFGGFPEVDFNALDGASSASGTLAISNRIENATITVNYEGRIDW